MTIEYKHFLNFLNEKNIKLFDYKKRIFFSKYNKLLEENEKYINFITNNNLHNDLIYNIINDVNNDNLYSLKYFFSL